MLIIVFARSVDYTKKNIGAKETAVIASASSRYFDRAMVAHNLTICSVNFSLLNGNHSLFIPLEAIEV